MEKISNYNCDGLCCEKTCNKRYTDTITIKIHGIDLCLAFCEEHGEEFEANIKNPPTIGEKGEIRIAKVICVDKTHVYIQCPYCNKQHLHGSGGNINEKNYGYRIPHCEIPANGTYELVCNEQTKRVIIVG